ncbi:MAG: ferrous iron transporter B [Blastocatellia bacterium]|nr:ferrous iron transporter B [Blastocatellia bacterium]
MGSLKTHAGDIPSSSPESSSRSANSCLTVCLVGMPNAGKTTLMNALTGGGFQTANYPGVTVSLLKGKSKQEFGEVVDLVDLPGVHSAVSPSPEEELSCKVLEGRHPSVKPDAFVLVVDATQLERHLKFAGYAARQGKPVVVAVTMNDLLPRLGLELDSAKLAARLKLPVVAVDARSGEGAKELLQSVREQIEVSSDNELALLPSDPAEAYKKVRQLIEESNALRQTPGDKKTRFTDSFTTKVDSIVLHKFLGFPIFFLIFALLFASIFWFATPFMDAIDLGFSYLQKFISASLPESIITDFLAEGVVGGVGAVAVFFPQIVILFFLMTLLEDSGYLARGAALVDKPLSLLGLHGRSFVPMLSGFACAIPAVLATRAIPTKRERLLTIWIIPLMSCSARLPVYSLLLAALLVDEPSWKAGSALAAIYLASIIIGSITAGVVGKLLYKKRSLSLLAMEMPAYRIPQTKPILKITWTRSSSYLKKAGLPIVVVSSLLWLITNFGFALPASEQTSNPPSSSFIVKSDIDSSVAAQIGRKMEVVLRPMGVDWRVGVGLLSAFAAREVFVSSMAIVFHVTAGEDDEEAQQVGLLEQMKKATFANSSEKIFTPSTMVGLIVFFFFSLQCVSTVAVVARESSWRVATAQVVFYTGVGYLLSTLVVQGLRLAGVN